MSRRVRTSSPYSRLRDYSSPVWILTNNSTWAPVYSAVLSALLNPRPWTKIFLRKKNTLIKYVRIQGARLFAWTSRLRSAGGGRKKSMDHPVVPDVVFSEVQIPPLIKRAIQQFSAPCGWERVGLQGRSPKKVTLAYHFGVELRRTGSENTKWVCLIDNCMNL